MLCAHRHHFFSRLRFVSFACISDAALESIKVTLRDTSAGSEAGEGERPDGDEGEARGNEGTVLWQG